MLIAALPLLEGWDSFYVIIGSSAAALTGLMFVVIALMADVNRPRDSAALAAFATPTIVHFSAVLLVAAFVSMPWHSMASVRYCLLLAGTAGVLYAVWVIIRAHRQTSYRPELEDWIFHALLPVIAYAALFLAALLLRAFEEGALFGVAGSALLLLFIGIHNAWDSAVWMTLGAPDPMQDDERNIRETIDRWHRATRAGNLTEVLSLMADDIVFLTPGRPPMNKTAFAQAFKGLSGGPPMETKQEIREIHVAGDLAYCWSHLSVTMDAKTRSGHILSIFRKRSDGSWVLVRDANLLTGGA